MIALALPEIRPSSTVSLVDKEEDNAVRSEEADPVSTVKLKVEPSAFSKVNTLSVTEPVTIKDPVFIVGTFKATSAIKACEAEVAVLA